MSKIVASDAWNERGEAHYDRREIPEALGCFLRALECGADPKNHAFQRWACWMLLGEFERAWKESDEAGASFRGTASLVSGRVLIRCLHGLGDAIQFLRYAPELRLRCDHLTVHAPAQLLPLCEFIAGIDQSISLDHTLNTQDYDFEIECSDLPYLFRTTQSNIPCGRGYLRVPAEQLGRCPPILLPEERNCLKAAIVWAAGSWHPSRSIPLDLLEPLTQIPGLTLFSLQKGSEIRQLTASSHREKLVDLGSAAKDIVDTMILISNVDLVISVDTMVAHLAGALGKPIWTLLSYAADWRWMLDRGDSPWYRSMRLVRQARPGDWGNVVDELTRELRKQCAAISRTPEVCQRRSAQNHLIS
jgi:hypothetical protein